MDSASDVAGIDRMVITALTNLGVSRKGADRRLAAARERLETRPGTPSESDLVGEALRI